MNTKLYFFCVIFSILSVFASASEMDITVKTDTFSLPGTLVMPENKAQKVTCVVFVHGSGPCDRDETIGPNKIFKEIADSLAAKGIASIRYDKRTFIYKDKFVPQGCEPDYYFETVDDAVSAVNLAKSIDGIDGDRIFIIGHSLGAMLAPEIAKKAGNIAGLIMLAPPSQKLLDLMISQCDFLSKFYTGLGASEAVKMVEQMKSAAENGKKLGSADYDEKIGLPAGLTESYIKADNDYDAVSVAKSVNTEMFLVFGMRDYQVPYTNYMIWLKSLASKSNVKVKMYFGVNHIMREGSGELSPLEYNEKKGISPAVLNDIVSFINAH